MSVYRRETKAGPHWVCDFMVGGHRVNRTLPGVKTKREATLAEARLRDEYRGRLNRSGHLTTMTLETAMQRYVAERLKPKCKPAAMATYITYLAMIREHFGPGTPVEDIRNPAVAEWWGSLLGRVQENTAARYLTQLKAVLKFAKEAGAGNEVPAFRPRVRDDARIRWLTPEEEAALLLASPSWLQDLIVFFVETGARKSEALAVRWRDVDLQRQPRGVVRLMETKGGEPRGVPLSRRAAELLVRIRKARPNAKPDDRVFLCPARDGETLLPVGDFKKSWAGAVGKAAIADVHVHDLRHTFASRLVMKGVPLFQVGKLIGHRTMKMTLRYAHLAPEGLDTAIAALDGKPVRRKHGARPRPAIGG